MDTPDLQPHQRELPSIFERKPGLLGFRGFGESLGRFGRGAAGARREFWQGGGAAGPRGKGENRIGSPRCGDHRKLLKEPGEKQL